MYINVDNITPSHLREVADLMEKDGVKYIQLYPDQNHWDGPYIEETYYTEESSQEA